MKFFSEDEIRSNRVCRAIGDLKRGVPITVNKEYLIAAVETLSEAKFNKLRQSFKDKLTLVERGAANNDKLLKKLAELTKLLPAFLLVRLESKDDEFLSESCISNLDEADLIAYGKSVTINLEQIITDISIPLASTSQASMTIFRVRESGEEHYAITIGKLGSVDPLVRLHSSCYTGDLLQSLRCDCSNQLLEAIGIMSTSPENAGVIIYLAQEGRGIGLANKLRAYGVQDSGYDTVEANELLGFDMDIRDYSIAREMLKKIGLTRIRLLTNNPQKIKDLATNGIEISEVLPLRTKSNMYNKGYIETKRNKMAHHTI